MDASPSGVLRGLDSGAVELVPLYNSVGEVDTTAGIAKEVLSVLERDTLV
jgi:hypothetical protein